MYANTARLNICENVESATPSMLQAMRGFSNGWGVDKKYHWRRTLPGVKHSEWIVAGPFFAELWIAATACHPIEFVVVWFVGAFLCLVGCALPLFVGAAQNQRYGCREVCRHARFFRFCLANAVEFLLLRPWSPFRRRGCRCRPRWGRW